MSAAAGSCSAGDLEDGEAIEFEVIGEHSQDPLPMNQQALVQGTGKRKGGNLQPSAVKRQRCATTKGGKPRTVLVSCFSDCEKTVDADDGSKHVHQGRVCLACGAAKYYGVPVATRDAYNSNKMGLHIGACPEISYESICALVQEGCKSAPVTKRKARMEAEREAKRRMDAPPCDEPSPKPLQLCAPPPPSDSDIVVTSSSSSGLPLKNQLSIAGALTTCTPSNASTILWYMTRWLLASASSFRTTECPFFRDMVRILNPTFYKYYMPKTTWVFVHTYLDKVYNHVLKQTGRVVGRGRELRTIAGDGVLVTNMHFNNYTIGHQGKCVYKDSVRQTEANTKEYHHEQWLLQLRKDVDGSELTDAKVVEMYCGLVGDNVHYMRESGEMVVAEPTLRELFAVGCLGHLFDKVCEDLAKIDEIADQIADNEKIVLCGKNIEDKVLAPFRKDSPWQTKFRTYPDTRFGYAGDMMDSVNANKPLLSVVTSSPSWEQPMPGYTTNDKTPSKAHKYCTLMADKIGEANWCKRNVALAYLWEPIQLLIAFIGGGHARCAFVVPLIMSLVRWIEAWQKKPHVTSSMKATTIAEVLQVVITRWGGTQWRTERTRKVGIKCDAHLMASATFPHTLDWNDEGIAILAPGTKDACRRILKRYTTEGPSQEGEVAIYMDELSNFWQRNGEWAEPIMRAMADTESKLGKLYHESLAGEPALDEYVDRMIHRCTVATDPRSWWAMQLHASPLLRRIMNRLHSMEPSSIGPERINKYLKTIMVPSRSSLRSDRVVKAMFVYANLRFLNKVASIEEKLLEFLVNAPELDMTIEEVAQVENDTSTLSAIQQEPAIANSLDSG